MSFFANRIKHVLNRYNKLLTSVDFLNLMTLRSSQGLAMTSKGNGDGLMQGAVALLSTQNGLTCADFSSVLASEGLDRAPMWRSHELIEINYKTKKYAINFCTNEHIAVYKKLGSRELGKAGARHANFARKVLLG